MAKPTDHGGIRLTPSQRRRLVVALGRAEAALDAVERTDGAPATALRLSREAPDLPTRLPGRVRELAGTLAREIRTLADDLSLHPLVSSRRRHLLSLCTTSAIGLRESGSRSLRGYGAVDPAMAELVDPVLARLEAGLFLIAEELSGATEG